MKIVNLLIILLFALSTKVIAAPDISSVSGTISHGNNLTISGSSFGSHPDNGGAASYLNYKYDDFEDGSVNNVFTATNTFGSTSVFINSDNARSSNSTYNALRDKDVSNTFGVAIGSSSTNDGYYTSVWAKRPSGTTFGSSGQVKMIRIYHAGTVYPNITAGKHQFTSSTNHITTIEATPFNQYLGNHTFWDDGNWHRLELWFKPSTGIGNTDGQIKEWLDGNIILNTSTARTDNAGFNTYHGNWWVFGYYFQASNDSYLDDVYFDYTQARVEIGNALNWEDCTHRELLIPKSWSTTQVVAELNQGSFTNGDTVYVFVVDSSGNISDEDTGASGSQGYPVVIGEGEISDVVPPSFSNLDPTDGEIGVSLAKDPILYFTVADAGDGVVESSINVDFNINNTNFFNEDADLSITGTTASYNVSPLASLSASLTYGDVIYYLPKANDGTNQTANDLTKSFTMETEPVSSVFASGDIGDLDNYTKITDSRWETANESGDIVAKINTTSYSNLATDRLGELAFFSTAYSDFQLDLDVRIDDSIGVNTWGDVCIVFGYVDASNYYYFMANYQTNESAIYQVVSGVRQAALVSYSGQLVSDSNFHAVRITNASGQVAIEWDSTPILLVVESVPTGKIGFGSYNDAASFDDPVVTVNVVEPVKRARLSGSASGRMSSYGEGYSHSY